MGIALICGNRKERSLLLHPPCSIYRSCAITTAIIYWLLNEGIFTDYYITQNDLAMNFGRFNIIGDLKKRKLVSVVIVIFSLVFSELFL